MALEMEAIQHPRGDWVVKMSNGVMRPGVFDSKETAEQSMYVPAPTLQSIYVPMRDGGSPLTMDQIKAAMRVKLHRPASPRSRFERASDYVPTKVRAASVGS